MNFAKKLSGIATNFNKSKQLECGTVNSLYDQGYSFTDYVKRRSFIESSIGKFSILVNLPLLPWTKKDIVDSYPELEKMGFKLNDAGTSIPLLVVRWT